MHTQDGVKEYSGKGRVCLSPISLHIVGVFFLALASYLTYDSIESLLGREASVHSLPGIILATASLIVMPLLAQAKREVAVGLASAVCLLKE
jgi:divalent metal cation (Fe/Co/Zn/Cd) transporter